MLGGDHDILHAGVLRRKHPCVGAEAGRVEPRGQRGVFLQGHPFVNHEMLIALCGMALPFASGHGIKSPMNKHPEARLAPPRHPRVALGGSFFLRVQLNGTLAEGSDGRIGIIGTASASDGGREQGDLDFTLHKYNRLTVCG